MTHSCVRYAFFLVADFEGLDVDFDGFVDLDAACRIFLTLLSERGAGGGFGTATSTPLSYRALRFTGRATLSLLSASLWLVGSDLKNTNVFSESNGILHVS